MITDATLTDELNVLYVQVTKLQNKIFYITGKCACSDGRLCAFHASTLNHLKDAGDALQNAVASLQEER